MDEGAFFWDEADGSRHSTHTEDVKRVQNVIAWNASTGARHLAGADPLIRGEWKDFESALEAAYLLTIFGYGAPVTDAKAVEAMKSAWSRPGARELEEVEILDVKSDEELYATWSPFIVRSHYRVYNDFFSSTLARWPRRTGEAIRNQFMMLRLSEKNYAPRDASLGQLQSWHAALIRAEESAQQDAAQDG